MLQLIRRMLRRFQLARMFPSLLAMADSSLPRTSFLDLVETLRRCTVCLATSRRILVNFVPGPFFSAIASFRSPLEIPIVPVLAINCGDEFLC